MKSLTISIWIVAAIAVFSIASMILPASPFTSYLVWSDLSDYLPYINYFVPVDKIFAISEVWLAAVNLLMTYQFATKAVSTVTDLMPLV